MKRPDLKLYFAGSQIERIFFFRKNIILHLIEMKSLIGAATACEATLQL